MKHRLQEISNYLPLNKGIELSTKVIAVGNPEINWIALSENVQIIGNKLNTAITIFIKIMKLKS